MPDMNDLLERAMGTFALLANANYELSSILNPRFGRLCFPSTPVTTDLFGDEIPRLVEDIQRSHKLERNLANNRGKRGNYQNHGRRGFNNRGRGGSNRGNGRFNNNGYNNNNNNNRGGSNSNSWPKNSKRGGNAKRQQ